MITPKYDMHTHTYYSFDNDTPMSAYPQKALESGVKVLCFTDHIDCTPKFDVLKDFKFGQRAEEFHRLKEQYRGKVNLLLGFEVGEPHLHPDVMKFLNSLEPDMIIGSVHRPGDYEPPRTYTNPQYERLYDRYVREMVSAGGFDVLGHLNLPIRWHADYVEDLETLQRTLEICVKNDIVPEMNTSQFRRGKEYTMPHAELIRYYAEHGGKYVTIGSDCHEAESLAANFDKALAQVPQGVELCYFEKRKRKIFDPTNF